MPRLQLDGIDVCASWLTQRSYRAAYCDFLLPLTEQTKDQMLDEFRREKEFGKYRGLRVSGISDISFLTEFPRLLYLEVLGQKSFNTRHLDGLSNLRGLRVESPGAGLDFACFPELEVFVGDWHVDNHNLCKSRELRRLNVQQFHPRSGDLSDIANIPRLEWLQVAQTRITALAGVETLQDLRYLELTHAAKLASLQALASNQIGIRELSIEKAKSISSYLPIASIPCLRRLKLSSCAPMSDLRWTQSMKDLDFLSLVGTEVKDGDLAALLDLPKLAYVGVDNKKHHNLTFQQINERLLQQASRRDSP